MGRLTAAYLAASLAPSAAKQKLPAFAFDKSTTWGQPDGQVRSWPGPNVEALTAGWICQSRNAANPPG